MRYPDGGGLTAAGRARREKVRLQAAAMFEQDMDPAPMACQLRVSAKSAYQRQRRRNTGTAGNRSWQIDEDVTEVRTPPKADIRR